MAHHHLPRLRSYLPRILVLAAVGLLAGSGVANATGEQRQERAPAEDPTCEQGEFCVWPEEFYDGAPTKFDLRNTNPEECVPLPDNIVARSFVNRIDRHVTVYQDRHCSTEGDFSTYPGGGTFVPRAQYLGRAIQIWN
ncbi:peptidase inhibitor family I36 protein [Amycolatopsis aidingensis]|uniref:peptidase inhibitor family I36 protein n=1 Tax=Amycolatopsis aidingensis TaxID=2842453 RepID=UPI001C0B07F7|nr:peptidase inhibitor family I36 protein [Amycolatopsis aidingensis]